MPNNLVLTPGGYRDAALVHHVAADTVIDTSQGRLRQLSLTGDVLADHGPLRPLNIYAPEEKIVPAFGSGWITYASWTNDIGTPVSRFATTWTVPPEPLTSNGQTIFLFSGIQNSTMIYQPVLQWGPSAAGGGANWAVSSWYAASTGHSFYTTPVNVNVGDVLTGVMVMTGTSGAQHSYSCEFDGIANTTLNITNVEELTWCIETLEAYSITAATDYPNTFSTPMTGINLTTGTTHPAITWTATDVVTDCGQHTIVVDNSSTSGEVDICYKVGSVTPTFGVRIFRPIFDHEGMNQLHARGWQNIDGTGGGMSDQNDDTYLENSAGSVQDEWFDPTSDCGRITLSGMPARLRLFVRVSLEVYTEDQPQVLGNFINLRIVGSSSLAVTAYFGDSLGYEGPLTGVPANCDTGPMIGGNGINLTGSLADLGSGPSQFYLDVVGWENINGSGLRIHDWWIEVAGGVPPLRQRARNDGVTTDTRQEVRQKSASPLLVPDLWWVGGEGGGFYQLFHD
jgi:hypothetical protein